MKRLLFRLATAIVILYPVISDRVMRTLDYECVFLPDKNPVFVVAMAFVGHHIPCVVIVVCYAVVYYEIRRLVKTRPQYRVDPARSVMPLKIRPDISRYRPVAIVPCLLYSAYWFLASILFRNRNCFSSCSFSLYILVSRLGLKMC